jgi:acyl-CoA synthetase (AMP-forming)/AMP-acid ligase II/acyl carrier protein
MGRSKRYDKPRTILDILRRRAAEEPETNAYRFISESRGEVAAISYSDVDRRAAVIGGWLQDRGLAGKPVALIFPPGLDFVAALFGTFYGGAIAVPLDAPGAANPGARLGALLGDSNARVLLTTASLVGRISRAIATIPELVIELIAIESVPDEAEAQWQHPGTATEDLAILQYTSGSTAAPKGVKVRHSNLLHNLELMRRVSGHDRSSIGVSWLPQYHDMGLVGGIMLPAFVGFPVILMSPASFLARPVRWLKTISDYGATASGAPNFAYEHCLRKIREDELPEIDLRSWRVAYCGAEPIRPETVDRFAAMFGGCGFRKTAFFPCYGLAEATLMVSGGPAGASPCSLQLARASLNEGRAVESEVGAPDTVEAAASGALITDNDVIIVDPRRRTRCAENHVGEIWVSGPSVGAGYWNRPHETEETFGACLADGEAGVHFLRTGDLGFIHNGLLFVSGRIKDLIIIRGMNHYPQDIERTVEDSCSALRRGCGAAFSIEVANEERLALAYELRARTVQPVEIDFNAIVRSVAEHHGLQVHCIVLARHGTIPKTTSGKIRRQECRSRFLAGTLAMLHEWRASAGEHLGPTITGLSEAVHFDPSRGNSQILPIIIDEVATVLGADPTCIDPRESIYALGFDSLAAARLRSRLLSIFGVELELSDFLAVSTLADLNDRIVARIAAPSTSVTEDRAKRLLERVAQLSDKEVAEILAAEAKQPQR